VDASQVASSVVEHFDTCSLGRLAWGLPGRSPDSSERTNDDDIQGHGRGRGREFDRERSAMKAGPPALALPKSEGTAGIRYARTRSRLAIWAPHKGRTMRESGLRP
jgi:hypothetical protein